jgi:hypothetical protein
MQLFDRSVADIKPPPSWRAPQAAVGVLGSFVRTFSARRARRTSPGRAISGSVAGRCAGRWQRWESCRTLDEARRAKAARQTDIGRGEFEEHSRVTLHDFLMEWIDRYQGAGRRGFREETRAKCRERGGLPRVNLVPRGTKSLRAPGSNGTFATSQSASATRPSL